MQETVILDDIRTDGGTQPREYLNELVLSEYAESMASGTVFPPVVIFFDGSHYWLADGFHRFFAAKKCGARDIVSEVRQGTRRDARLYAVGANATHGLRRTNADKRRAALTLLQDEEWQRWSNREIARQCGVTHTFVAKLRRDLLEEPPAAIAETSAARTESASSTPSRRPSAVGLPDTEFTGSSDAFFDASASRHREDLFDQLSPAEPFTTPFAGAPSQHPTGIPDAPRTPENGTAMGHDGRLTIEAMASTSQQAPAEWMTEMMVYWLLDLAAQYDGVTPALIRQAAERLATQYEQACRESPH